MTERLTHTHTHTHLSKRSPNDSRGKESACNARGESLIPGLEDPLEEETVGYSPLGLESRTQLSTHTHACIHLSKCVCLVLSLSCKDSYLFWPEFPPWPGKSSFFNLSIQIPPMFAFGWLAGWFFKPSPSPTSFLEETLLTHLPMCL